MGQLHIVPLMKNWLLLKNSIESQERIVFMNYLIIGKLLSAFY